MVQLLVEVMICRWVHFRMIPRAIHLSLLYFSKLTLYVNIKFFKKVIVEGLCKKEIN